MIFQKLLPIDMPYATYYTASSSPTPFPKHFHHEIELIYCKSGEVLLGVNDAAVTLVGGDLMLIESMTAHEVIFTRPETVFLAIDAGPTFLKSAFSAVCSIKSGAKPIARRSDPASPAELFRALDSIVEKKKESASIGTDLEITGLLYIVFGILTRYATDKSDEKRTLALASIQTALETIRTGYSRQISLEDVAARSGYSKGYFCKIFKELTGTGFHDYLNSYRIETSLPLLAETSLSIGEIAELVGFTEAKSFCRVFKECTEKTPSEYRALSRNKK